MSGTIASSASLSVSGAVANPLTLTDAALASNYTPVTITVGGVTYTGASVYGVISSAQFTSPAGVKNGQLLDYLQVTGASGSQVVLSEGEIDPGFGGASSVDIIAYAANGTAIAPQLIVPGDVNGGIGGRDIAGIINIAVGTASVPGSAVSSASPAPLTLSGTLGNAQNPVSVATAEMLGGTVQKDSFTAGSSAQTFTFTGVPMFSLLANAGISSDVLDSYVVAAGSDGYGVVYSGGEIDPATRAGATALVAYDDGTGTFPSVGGVSGAFRTTAPFDAKGGRYVSSLDTLAVGTAIPSAPIANYQVPTAQYTSATAAAITAALAAAASGSTPYATISPDGSSFASVVTNNFNIAVVSDPTGGTLTVPGGYRALVLQGTAAVGAADPATGGVLIVGNTGNDVLYAGAASDTLIAGGGADTLAGNAAGDVLIASSGTNVLSLNIGAETAFTQSSSNLVFLGAGTSQLASGGADTIVGGSGNSTVFAAQSVTATLGSGRMAFVNGAGASTVGGGLGTATLFAGAGGGVFFGGLAGNNSLIGGTGAATLVGGGSGDQIFSATNGQVLVAGAGNETLSGGGSGGGNVYIGNGGSDLIVSGPGNDVVVTGSGNSTVVLGNGSDVVWVGSGAESIVAGSGPDLFAFVNGAGGGTDVIFGFKAGIDHIGLGGYTAAQITSVAAGMTSSANTTSFSLPDGTHILLAGVSGVGASTLL